MIDQRRLNQKSVTVLSASTVVARGGSGTREPLLPPPPAVMCSRAALGYARRPVEHALGGADGEDKANRSVCFSGAVAG